MAAKLIARLSTTITRIKTLVFTKFPLRLLWYTAVVLLLLLYWMFGPQQQIDFVYNAF